MSVELIEQSSPELVAAMERLIPQLSRSAKPLTAEQTQALVDQDSVYLFVFRTDKPVIAADGNEVEAVKIFLTGDDEVAAVLGFGSSSGRERSSGVKVK